MCERERENGGERKKWNLDVLHLVSLLDKIIFKKQESISRFFISKICFIVTLKSKNLIYLVININLSIISDISHDQDIYEKFDYK